MWVLIWWVEDRRWSVPMEAKQLKEIMNRRRRSSGNNAVFEEGQKVEVKWTDGKDCSGIIKKISSKYPFVRAGWINHASRSYL